MAVQSAPDWLMKPTLPARAIMLAAKVAFRPAKVAFRPAKGRITPRQFGPISRIRPRRACSSTCRSSSAPAVPVSLKPAEMTIAPRTPASTHSPIRSGTVGARVAMTARSTGSGTADSFGYALIPSTLGRFRLIGKTVPPNGLLIRFQRTMRPTLPGLSVAPITATVRGAKIASSGLRRVCRTSCAVLILGALG